MTRCQSASGNSCARTGVRRDAALLTRISTQLAKQNDMVKLMAPAGFLRGVWLPIPTVGYLGNVVYGRTDMPYQFAYDLARAIDERKELLETAYQHFFYNPKQIWKNYGVPLAPGAERYYREKGYLTNADER